MRASFAPYLGHQELAFPMKPRELVPLAAVDGDSYLKQNRRVLDLSPSPLEKELRQLRAESQALRDGLGQQSKWLFARAGELGAEGRRPPAKQASSPWRSPYEFGNPAADSRSGHNFPLIAPLKSSRVILSNTPNIDRFNRESFESELGFGLGRGLRGPQGLRGNSVFVPLSEANSSGGYSSGSKHHQDWDSEDAASKRRVDLAGAGPLPVKFVKPPLSQEEKKRQMAKDRETLQRRLDELTYALEAAEAEFDSEQSADRGRSEDRSRSRSRSASHSRSQSGSPVPGKDFQEATSRRKTSFQLPPSIPPSTRQSSSPDQESAIAGFPSYAPGQVSQVFTERTSRAVSEGSWVETPTSSAIGSPNRGVSRWSRRLRFLWAARAVKGDDLNLA